MFRCQYNRELSTVGERPVRLVIERRFVQYKNFDGEMIAEGWEIVRELFVRSINLEKAKKKHGVEDETKDWR